MSKKRLIVPKRLQQNTPLPLFCNFYWREAQIERYTSEHFTNVKSELHLLKSEA